ncbi:uncharacterized protein BX663DRAFT_555360 [Cokeromyces recurvatus]|uniref:uncharacterized protein n=1 Tax=Cokeromyces recurvatus TaxID=90255 RepID=UPI00221F9F4F|nr:uncharacterized protein BX663DRAFT_555360 [Cokeromyces recurvatus]KAI7899035.1 hypothetical protein BX663DRAFT_555360 [Cokeromyces recurvatus]
MSLQICYEDGKGDAVDEFCNNGIHMEADDEEQFPLDNLTPNKVRKELNMARRTAYNWFEKRLG